MTRWRFGLAPSDASWVAACLAWSANTAGCACSRCSRLAKRDFRLAALLACRIPFDAAMSSPLIAVSTNSDACSVWPTSMERRALVIPVLTADLADRLRRLRRAAERIAFLADAILAKAAPVRTIYCKHGPKLYTLQIWRRSMEEAYLGS